MYAKPAEGVISSLPDSVSLVDSAFVSVSVFDPLVDSVSVIGSLSEDTLVGSLSFFPQAVTAATIEHNKTRAAMIAIKLFSYL